MMKTKKRGSKGTLLCLLLCVVFLFSLALPVEAAGRHEQRQTLYVGGMPFGVRYFTEGILVVGFCDVECEGRNQNPARDAGVRAGDCIMALDGKHPESVSELADMIADCNGSALTLSLRREGRDITLSITPVACAADGRYRTGLWVRDSGAGLGTVTFIKDDNTFAGLGHGICDAETGCLIPMARGSVMGVEIGGITRGAVGTPGELKGHFSSGKAGVLTTNTLCGVYGVFTEKPAPTAGLLPIGTRDELHDGAASCWCTLDDNTPHEYSIRISDIHKGARDNKCFTVTVTDRTLLEKTGGIVQGMSGSPIVQDGRIVGAITHVLIGDPTTGYGIFIENMLENMPAAAG